MRLLAEDSDFLVGQVNWDSKATSLPVATVPFDLFQLVASKCVLMLPVAGFKVRGSSWHCHSSVLPTR